MTRRFSHIALFLSLALNLFLVVTAATLVTVSTRQSQARAPGRNVLRHAAMSLEPDRRRAFVALLRAEGRAVKPANQAARADRLAAWTSLEDRAFDPAVVKARLAAARALNQQSRGAVEDGVVDFAVALPPAQRSAFGAAMRAAMLANAPAPTDRKAGGGS